MNPRIAELLEEIREREEELEDLIRTQEKKILFRLEGNKVRFEAAVREAQKQMKVGIARWLRESKPRNLLSAPVIYSMIIPFVLLDACITLYQWVCFPLYRIAKVQRDKYIVIDRHHLSYLNAIEQFNCVYCGYVNGLVAYVREIVSRTEQYWCPIKHASKVLDPHRRYQRFAAFGDARGYRDSMTQQRQPRGR